MQIGSCSMPNRCRHRSVVSVSDGLSIQPGYTRRKDLTLRSDGLTAHSDKIRTDGIGKSLGTTREDRQGSGDESTCNFVGMHQYTNRSCWVVNVPKSDYDRKNNNHLTNN